MFDHGATSVVRLALWPRRHVEALARQHAAVTDVQVPDTVINKVLELSGGHPWEWQACLRRRASLTVS